MSRYRYPQPANEDAFEEFCLALLREVWSRPRLERYGHRGEEQHGVDLLDMSGKTPLLGVQCKHHDPTKTLPPAELEAEVRKALGFPDPIGEYVVLTTAKKGTRTQNRVRKLNEDHRAEGLFTIQLMTWDDIERLIDESATARQFLGLEATPASAQALRAELHPLQKVVTELVGEVQHADLDEAKTRLDKGEPQIALVFLERVRHRSWTDLSAGQRARLSRLEADARMRLGDARAAARLLLEAKEVAPDEERSAVNEIVAYELLEDNDRALACAIAARTRFPHLPGAHAAIIELSRSPEEALEAIGALPATVVDSPEVLAAIGGRHDLGERAGAAAKRATELAPDDPRAWFVLGTVLLDRQLERTHPQASGPLLPLSRPDLEAAREGFAKVLAIAAKAGNVGMQVAARLRRMVASGLLDDDVAVQDDAAEAVRLSPNDPHVLVAGGRAALQRRDANAAVNMLRQAAMRGGGGEAQFFLGVALWNRNDAGDRDEATSVLSGLARQDPAHAELAIELAVEGLLGASKFAEASSLIHDVSAHLESALTTTLHARVVTAAGEDGAARTAADAALEAVSASTARATLTKLAKILMAQGRFADALETLQRVARPGSEDDDAGRRLVECAVRLERHDVVLAYCSDARAIGLYDDYLLAHELRLLDRYDPPKAIEVLLEILARDPSNVEARVHLVVLAHRLARTALVREHLASLPPVTAVEAAQGAAVVALLREYGSPREAIAYAYDLLRLHFGDHHAHRAFRDANLWTSAADKEPEAPTEVTPGVAVAIAEAGEPPRWYVLEDSAVKAPQIECELQPDAPFSKLLIGKKVGDDVVLEAPGPPRVARIVDIVPKRVFRLRDVLDRWQFRFPDQNELWMMRVESTGEKTDFTSIFEVLRHGRERTEEAEKFYLDHAIPIGPFSRLLGTNEVRAVGHIASRETLRLRCCRGSRDEQMDAAAALAAAQEIVLDLAAIATLILAENLEVLESLGKTIIVSHSTMLTIRSLAAEASRGHRSEGAMHDTPDGPRLEIATEERRAAAEAFMSRIVTWLETHATVASAPQLAALAPETRNELQHLLGQGALESSVIATAPNRVLWTDDGVAAFVVTQKLGVRRVWTQIAFDWLAREGRIAADDYARLSARLIGWGYSFTSANDRVLRTAGELAEWDTQASPLRQALEYLALPEVRPRDALSLSAFLVRDAYRYALIAERRRAVLLGVLESIQRRQDLAQGAFDELGTALPRLFGVNVVGCDDAMQTLAAWRAGRHRIVRP